MYRVLKLNESDNLNEARTHRVLSRGDVYINPNGVKVQIIDVDNEHLLDGEPQVTYRFLDTNETKCYKNSSVVSFINDNGYALDESALTEDIEDDIEDAEQAEDNIEDAQDTIDSEEDQEENPVEEENELDKKLDELREVLPDLNLRLYQVTNKEKPADNFYFIGKVAEDTNDVLMLVDNKPEEVNDDNDILAAPIADEDDLEEAIPGTDEQIEQAKEESKEKGLYTEEEEPEEILEPLEDRFDYVKIPNRFEEFKTLIPRYGEDLNPDHQAIMDYLMNCLIEIDPEAAEEIKKDAEADEEVPVPVEDIEFGEEEPIDEN